MLYVSTPRSHTDNFLHVCYRLLLFCCIVSLIFLFSFIDTRHTIREFILKAAEFNILAQINLYMENIVLLKLFAPCIETIKTEFYNNEKLKPKLEQSLDFLSAPDLRHNTQLTMHSFSLQSSYLISTLLAKP